MAAVVEQGRGWGRPAPRGRTLGSRADPHSPPQPAPSWDSPFKAAHPTSTPSPPPTRSGAPTLLFDEAPGVYTVRQEARRATSQLGLAISSSTLSPILSRLVYGQADTVSFTEPETLNRGYNAYVVEWGIAQLRVPSSDAS